MSSSVSDESAVITIEVELVSNVKGDPTTAGGEEQKPFLSGFGDDEFKNIVAEEVNTAIKDEIDSALSAEGIDLEGMKKLTDTVKDLDNKAMGNITSIAKNPEAFMENTMMRVLGKAGPYGALTAAIIAAIAGSPEMVTAVVDALGVKGGPLNQDYAFSQEEQMNLNLSRITQFKRVTGDDPFITVLTKGFVVGDPDFDGNSLVDADLARTGRVLLRESSLGYIHGI